MVICRWPREMRGAHGESSDNKMISGANIEMLSWKTFGLDRAVAKCAFAARFQSAIVDVATSDKCSKTDDFVETTNRLTA